MYTMHDVICPATEAELLSLAQKKSSTILGGLMWLKLGRGTIRQGIDLQELHWDTISVDSEGITIGAATNLHTLETNAELQQLSQGAVATALAHIVGPAFRNGATLGGSIALRAGFSDIYTLFCALDAEVLLAGRDRQKLAEFALAKRERIVVKGLFVPQREQRVYYRCQRAEAGDLPLLNLCLVEQGGQLTVTCGARPSIAVKLSLDKKMLDQWSQQASRESRLRVLQQVAEQFSWSDNLRASAAYRRQLFVVLLDDALSEYQKEVGDVEN